MDIYCDSSEDIITESIRPPALICVIYVEKLVFACE